MFIIVDATVGDETFTLRAQRFDATGNYQVQNCGDNKRFFSRIQALGAEVSYITLKNGTWEQVLGPRSINLGDDKKLYFTNFDLNAAPALPPPRKAAKARGGGGGGGPSGGAAKA